MRVTFCVNFNTHPGQDLFIALNGNNLPMNYNAGGVWSLSLEDSDSKYADIKYSYFVKDGDQTMFEAGSARHSLIGKTISCIEFHDQWQGIDENAPFLTAPFTDIFNHHDVDCLKYGKFDKEIVVRVTVPNVESDETVCLSGNVKQLGDWVPDKALRMHYAGSSRWEAQMNYVPGLEYKFIRRSKDGIEWESGDNHTLEIEIAEDGKVCLIEHSSASFQNRKPRIAGTAIPVFSLRSRFCCGVGDFVAIKKLVDWAVLTGQKIIQLLPINDTTSSKSWMDSYPYSGISVMALHPLYLNLGAMGLPNDETLRNRFEKRRKVLESLAQIDYEAVMKLKMDYATQIFKERGEETLKSDNFKTFFNNNSDWLLPYAAFCYLRDRFGTADFAQWGKYAQYNQLEIEKLWNSKSVGHILRLHCFIQYHLDTQLHQARDYAHTKGVALKGDIPIGITPHSVEAWKEPYYFHMDSQAGAPPDYFSADGQNWGFPTYNWERMAEDGYIWWKRRFTKMAEYFDAYRIDHVLGFFRIWEIPQGFQSGKMGHFAPALPYSRDELVSRGMNFDLFLEDTHRPGYYHPRIDSKGKGGSAMDALYDDFFYVRHNEFWRAQARRKLPALIAATNMLTCAEDLGMIPDCVPEVLDDLKILTLEIQRMPKDPNMDLANPNSFPYLSVCTTGSHDTSTLRGWWGERNNGQDCSVDTCRWIISEHLHSPSMLAILPWQDWTSIDSELRFPDTSQERINDPADPHHYWRYRMHINLEDLLKMKDFNDKVSDMIASSGR